MIKFFPNYLFLLNMLLFLTIAIDNVHAAAATSTDGDKLFTPGKAVSGKIGAQLLKLKTSITEIFGDEETEAEYRVLFENPPRTGDSDFRSTLFRIKRGLERRLGEGGEIPRIFGEITQIRNQLEEIPDERLEHYATEYFGKMEEFERIEFQAKPDGDQLGAKALVTLSGKPVIFYIKTHSLGHKTLSRSSGAHRLNSVEFMVYAVLDELGDGPEVHFFGRDDKNAYIATKYAGEEGAEFHTYEYDTKDSKRKETLWGPEVFGYIEGTRYEERDKDVLMGIIDGNAQSRALADKLSRIDIISRTLRLSDLIGNTGNFGFTLSEDGTIKHSIIDFRIISDETGEYRIKEGNLNGFYRGNGIFSALEADEFVIHVLRDRPAEVRAERVLPHITEIQERLPEAVGVAIERVTGFIDSLLVNIEGDAEKEKFRSESLRAITQYGEALIHNARMYLEYIASGAPKI